jgi:hypothetical protein
MPAQASKDDAATRCYRNGAMDYSTIAFGLFGVAVGLLLRFRVLLLIIVLVAVVTIAVSVLSGRSFTETTMSLMKWQVILQSSYFLGLILKTVFSSNISHRLLI